MANKTLLNDKLKERLINLTSLYFFWHIVAAKAGITREVFWKYRKQDKKLLTALMHARDIYLGIAVDTADSVGLKDWRYLAHKLSIADPEHFSEKRRLDLKVDEGISIIIEKADRKGKK